MRASPEPDDDTAAEQARERAVDRAGLRLLTSLIVWLLLLYAVAEHVGLKYAEIAGWPTDVYAFAHGPETAVDIAIIGSSKASYGLPPEAMTTCLQRRFRRAVRVVNLGRMYGTMWSAWSILRDTLGERPPRVLLIGLEHEMFDDHNAKMVESFPMTATLAELPALFAAAPGWGAGVASVRTLARGAEHLAGYTLSAAAVDMRIRWMMRAHGGGQWCYAPACRGVVRDRWRSDFKMWDHRIEVEMPFLREQRFAASSIGDGINGRATDDILAWAAANDVRVIGAEIPLHRAFLEQIPEELEAQYRARLAELGAAGVRIWAPDPAEYLDDRSAFLDPEHLNPVGAQRYAGDLCAELLVPLWREMGVTAAPGGSGGRDGEAERRTPGREAPRSP